MSDVTELAKRAATLRGQVNLLTAKIRKRCNDLNPSDEDLTDEEKEKMLKLRLEADEAEAKFRLARVEQGGEEMFAGTDVIKSAAQVAEGSRRAVRAASYLKDFVLTTLERYKEGAVDHGQAAMLIWNEIQSVTLQTYSGGFADIAQLRIAGDGDGAALGLCSEFGDIVSLRHVGPRETGEPVKYVDVALPGALAAEQLIKVLKDSGYEVRDWSFGCHRT
jgi:hypothetical protein